MGKALGSIIQPPKLGIGVIGELAGDDWPLSCEEQQFNVLRHAADFIRGEQRPRRVMLTVGDTGFFGIEGAPHGLKDDSFLSEQIGNQAGAVVVVDAEDLEDAGIRQEGAGALSIGGTELVDVLQDRPELDAIAGHEAHGAFDWGQMAEGGELVEKIKHRDGWLHWLARHVREALGDEQAQPS